MRRRGLLCKCAALFATALLVGNLGVLPVNAGASTIVIDDTSYAEKIDDGMWSNPDGNVTTKAGVLVFPKESTSDTRLITKNSARISEMKDELVNAKATIRLENLPKGEKFIFALGLSSIEAIPEENGNVEIQFVNNNGIKASVVAYGNEGATEVVSSTSVGKLNSDIKVEVSITKAGNLTLQVGGRVIGKGQLPVSGEGRVGFLQSGSCAAKVRDVKIMSYQYDRPENPDVFEDFESGSMNLNLLTSKMTGYAAVYSPSYSRVQEYKDNQVFFCNNAGGTYIGTLYKYSNFEISFDVPYLQTLTEWTEEGEALKPISGDIIVGWGFQEPRPTEEWDYTVAEQSVSFRAGSKIIPQGYSDLTVVSEEYPFFSPGCERGASIKISVIDATATVYLKWIDETEWTEVLSYQTGTRTSLGYIQLWTLTPTNMAIDNLKIVNKDINPQSITVDEKYDYLDKIEDYSYEKTESVYKDLAEKEEEFNWYILIPATAGVCVLALGVVLGVTLLKRRKKGGSNDEA